MGIGYGRDQDPGTGVTVRGAIVILVAGLALGAAYNALNLASRPPHGLAWVGGAPQLPSLEALLPAPGPTAAADSAARIVPTPGGPPATPPARKPARSPSAGALPVQTTGRGEAGTPPAGSSPASAPGAASPPREAPPPTPAAQAAPSSAAGDAPVVPDVPGPLKVELPLLKKLYDHDAALIVDAREAEEYAAGHIAGAVSLPYNDALADPAKVRRLDPGGRAIVVYCSGGSCELSMDLAKVLVDAGRRRVTVYEGGFPEWQAAGYPVRSGADAGGSP